MTERKVTISVGRDMSGAIAVGDGASAVSGGTAGGGLSHDDAALIALIRTNLPTVPADRRAGVAALVGQIEAEAAKPAPDRTKLRMLLKTLSTLAQGVIASLIATYMTK